MCINGYRYNKLLYFSVCVQVPTGKVESTICQPRAVEKIWHHEEMALSLSVFFLSKSKYAIVNCPVANWQLLKGHETKLPISSTYVFCTSAFQTKTCES